MNQLQVITEKRKKVIEAGSQALSNLRKYLECLENKEEILELLDSIEASKTILYSMYENDADKLVIEVMSTYNQVLNDLLGQAILKGAN